MLVIVDVDEMLMMDSHQDIIDILEPLDLHIGRAAVPRLCPLLATARTRLRRGRVQADLLPFIFSGCLLMAMNDDYG